MCCLSLRLSVNATYRVGCTTACGVLLFAGLLVHLVAIVAPAWALEATSVNRPFEGIGLWRMCRWDETIRNIKCTSLVMNSKNPGWLTIVQVMEAFSVGLLLGALMAVFFARTHASYHMRLPIYMLLGLNASGVLAMLTGVAVFGVAARTPSGDYFSDFPLGWAFYLDVLALVVFCLPPFFAAYLLAIVTKYPHAEMYPGSRMYT